MAAKAGNVMIAKTHPDFPSHLLEDGVVQRLSEITLELFWLGPLGQLNTLRCSRLAQTPLRMSRKTQRLSRGTVWAACPKVTSVCS